MAASPPPDPRSFFVDADADAVAPGADRFDPDRLASEPVEGAPPSRRRFRYRRLAIGGAAVLVTLALVYTLLAYRAYRGIGRIDVGDALAAETGDATNYLVLGSDSREGIDPQNKNIEVLGSLDTERTDTMVVLRLSKSGAVMMPIPRDLYVTISGTGKKERINTAFMGGGPTRLVQTIRDALGIPIHHVIEMNFAGFLDMVDALGGIEIDFDAPTFDNSSGLDIPTAGTHKLDADQALAYVRSRHFTRVVGGRPVEDPTADLGRITRQQEFLRAVMSKLGDTKNPLTLLSVANGVKKGMRLDKSMGFRDVIGFARQMRGLSPETVSLPVIPTTTAGGAAVLVLNEKESPAALARVR